MYVTRRTEVLRYGEWIQVRFEELKKGDIFKLFDPPNYKPVKWYDQLGGQVKFRAMSDPFLNEHAIWTIECDPVEEPTLYGVS